MSDEDILVSLKRVLNNYLSLVSGTNNVFIATLDGHVLLERNRQDYPLDLIAPMAGSVLGISETLSSQLLNQKFHDNIIMMEKNILGLFKADDREDSLYLGIICDRLVNLGKMITIAKLTTKEINQILENQDVE